MYTGNIKYSMFFQFSFEIRGQNSFPDNHWGEGGGGAGEKFANKTGNFRGDSMALFKCRPIRH